FFFQAEDGIRDYKVTGVQTCALPICGEQDEASGEDGETAHGPSTDSGPEWIGQLRSTGDHGLIRPHRELHGGGGRQHVGDGAARSEERRVGKEGRSRWSSWR